MEQQQQSPFDRGQITKMLILGAVLMFWMPLAPRLFPGLFGVKPPAAKAPVVKDAGEKPQPKDGTKQAHEIATATPEVKPVPVVIPAPVVPVVAPAIVPAVPVAPKVVFAEAPPTHHRLGAIERGQGFFLEVELTSKGAAVEWAKLNDERYSVLEDRKAPLKVIGNIADKADGTEPLSFYSGIDAIDAQLQKWNKTTRHADWELLAGATREIATYRIQAPDGSMAVRKTYRLHPGDEKQRDEDPQGYLLDIDLEIENLTDVALKQSYRLQGPVGLPLENVANTRSLMELKVETHDDTEELSDVTEIIRTATDVTNQYDKMHKENDPSKVDTYRDPIHYAGVDVQFFSAILIPSADQWKDADGDGKPDVYLESVRPMIVARNKEKPDRSSISLLMQSKHFQVPPKHTLKHSYQVYLGPKRKALASAIHIDSCLLEPTITIFKPITLLARPVEKLLQVVLQFYHRFVHLPYGLAIILLTFTVRMCLLPITRKQVYDGEKMKLITPELTKLKAKYANEPEKFVGAQKELMRRYNHNMFGGCLPLFFQMPIFIGLYGAVNTTIDLRMAPFLWINNLAAPDGLFRFGREIPWIGTTFNILPLFNVCLFLFQQKQMMPPAQNEEEQMRNKMMSYMTVGMGFLFYKVPAGLCLYFIASSLLGMAERHLLKKFMPPIIMRPENTPELIDPNRPKSLWQRTFESWVAAADAAKHQTDGQGNRPRGGR